MSIIHDALNKARRHNPAEKTLPISRHLEAEFQKKRAGINWGPIFVLLVLALITGPIVAPVFSVPFKNSSSHLTSFQARQVTAGKSIPGGSRASVNVPGSFVGAQNAQFAVEEVPLGPPAPAALYARPNLILSGVMFTTPANSYVIINNRVIKVGEYVQGAKLVEVTPHRVTLDFRGERIVLDVTEE